MVVESSGPPLIMHIVRAASLSAGSRLSARQGNNYWNSMSYSEHMQEQQYMCCMYTYYIVERMVHYIYYYANVGVVYYLDSVMGIK